MTWIAKGVVDWVDAAAALRDKGWVRLERALDDRRRSQLREAAPPTWAPLPEVEGRVRQGGLSCGVFFSDAAAEVQEFGDEIHESLTAAGHGLAPVPRFNEVQWGRSREGVGFITAHRDPPAAGGIIAIATLEGRALFRVWEGSEAIEWRTEDGDVVLLRGRGWPNADSLCPLHEVESPRMGDRMTMTLRHNLGGPGADYFP